MFFVCVDGQGLCKIEKGIDTITKTHFQRWQIQIHRIWHYVTKHFNNGEKKLPSDFVLSERHVKMLQNLVWLCYILKIIALKVL